MSCDERRACLLQVSVAAAERLLVARTGTAPLKASVESVPVSQSADALQPLYDATGLQVVAYDPTRVPIAAVPWYLSWLKKTKKAPSASSLCAALVEQNAGVTLPVMPPAMAALVTLTEPCTHKWSQIK